jgi:hypothetical protein
MIEKYQAYISVSFLRHNNEGMFLNERAKVKILLV